MRQLLVENVSTIQVPKPQLIESISKNGGRLIIKNVLLQRADTPNANKRVYPKRILERELSKYQSKIREKRAFSELDHPDCVRPSAQIMTFDGWKFIKDVVVGERVITLNTDKNSIEWNVVNAVVNEPYSGKMISIKGNNIDTVVTPNHRFILVDRSGNFVEKTAQEIYDAQFDGKSLPLHIPIVSDNWHGTSYDVWTLPPVKMKRDTKGTMDKQMVPLELDAEAFFAFLGFYLAEGHCAKIPYRIHITQNEGETAQKFRDVLKKLSPELNWTERKSILYSGNTKVVFSCSDARLYSYLHVLGDKYTKYVPDEIKNASSNLLQILVDWYLLGDGTSPSNGRYLRKSIFSVSKKMMEDFNEILLKIGICGVIKIQKQKNRKIHGRQVLESNSKDLYRLWFKRSKGVYIDFRFLKVDMIDYDDTVHCVNVDNGIFYCRDNRLPFWSGNSQLINLKNVCQGILDARWVGNEIYGDVEILNTPSGNIVREILLAGFRVGQSSRGLGSVEPLTEGDDADLVEVQDDFEFVTLADVVSDESTHGANMILMGESKQYIPDNGKYYMANKLITEILCELSGVCCYK